MRGNLSRFIPNILAILGYGLSFFDVPGEDKSRTPNLNKSHAFRPRYKPHIPNGKWVMKYHRNK